MAFWDEWGGLLSMGAGAILGSQSGSKEAGTTTTTSAPWAGQQPYLNDLFQRAKTQSNQPATTSLQQQALSGMQGANNNSLTDQARGVISNTLGMSPNNYFGIGKRVQLGANPYLDGGMSNPYLKASIDNASKDAMRNLMPAMGAANVASGSFGNSGVADTFGRAASEQLGNIANNAYMNQFNQNMGMVNQNNATNAQLDQQGIQNDMSQYNQGQSMLNNAAFNAPQFNTANIANQGTLYNAATMDSQQQWNPLKNYGSLITGNYGSTNSSPYYTNPTNGAIGGAMAGASVYSSLFK